MKVIKYIISVFFLFQSNAAGQTDTLAALSLFPLQTGNTWQYEGTIVIDPPVFTTYVTYTVLGDTLMPNGRRYKIMENNWNAYRIDTTELKVYIYQPYPESCPDSEMVYFDLNFPDSASYTTCFPYPVTVDSGSGAIGDLPGEARYLHYSWYDGINYTYKLSQGFGISEWSWWEGGGGEYTLIAAIIDSQQFGTFVTGISANITTKPDFTLYPNYPNPFNPSTTILYQMPTPADVKLTIFDSNGREVKILLNERQTAGLHSVPFDASNLASGIYIYRLTAGPFTQSRKMLLMR